MSTSRKTDRTIDTENDSSNLTRSRLVEDLHTEELGCSRKELRNIVDSVLDIMKFSLLEEQEVKISGFGKLKTKHKSARVGRNPHTDEELIISRRRVVSFQPSRLLTKKMNDE